MKPSEFVAKGWCQGMSARTSNGSACAADSSQATCWCLIGSINAAYPEDIRQREQVAGKLLNKLSTFRFAQWNDDPKRTQAEVVQLLQSIGE